MEEAVVPVIRDLQPGLEIAPYFLRGEVRHEDVGGTGFLEMWNVFPPKRQGQPEPRYFSRGLGEFGPMQKLEGTSAWREFMLPFRTSGVSSEPVRLEFNVVLPNGGTVWLRNLRLTQWEPGSNLAWAERWTGSGIAGAILGCMMGILGGIIGMCINKGKGRRIAQAALALILVIGIVSVAGAAWAILTKQWMWLTSLGVTAIIAVVLFPVLRLQMGSRFDEAELRPMHAADA